MKIRAEIPQYIRTLVEEDFDANDRIEQKLDADGWDGFPRFLAALFFLAVERRFGETLDRPEIVRFVAEIRAELDEDSDAINAESAETLIASIIDPNIDYDMPQDMIGKIQVATVRKYIRDANIQGKELDDLLAQAVSYAEQPMEE